jgi:hypothetical protein
MPKWLRSRIVKTARGLAVLIPLLSGCSEAPHAMDPLVFPSASEVEEISVVRLKPDGQYHDSFKVFDRQKIEEILIQLKANNTGYLSAMKGLTPQEYSIAVDTKNVMATMVWLGPDWLGGVDDHHRNENHVLTSHFRKLDGEQHTKLITLLRQAEAELSTEPPR